MTDSDRVTSAASHVRAMSERLGEGHDMCAYIIIAAVRPRVRDLAPRVRDRAESRGTKKLDITGKSVPTDRKN